MSGFANIYVIVSPVHLLFPMCHIRLVGHVDKENHDLYLALKNKPFSNTQKKVDFFECGKCRKILNSFRNMATFYFIN